MALIYGTRRCGAFSEEERDAAYEQYRAFS
jgi:hypothetical protein